MFTYRKEKFKTIEDYIVTYHDMGTSLVGFDRADDYVELFDKNLIWEGCLIRVCNIMVGGIVEGYGVVDRDNIFGLNLGCYSGKPGNHHPKNILDNYKQNWWEIDNMFWLDRVAQLINSKKN